VSVRPPNEKGWSSLILFICDKLGKIDSQIEVFAG